MLRVPRPRASKMFVGVVLVADGTRNKEEYNLCKLPDTICERLFFPTQYNPAQRAFYIIGKFGKLLII